MSTIHSSIERLKKNLLCVQQQTDLYNVIVGLGTKWNFGRSLHFAIFPENVASIARHKNKWTARDANTCIFEGGIEEGKFV